MILRLGKCSFRLLIGAALAYILLYVPNSILGGYWGPVAGQLKYSFGLSEPTLFLWQPYLGYRDHFNITACGVLWYPLIRIDQQYIHPSYDLNNANDEVYLFSKSNHMKWHPELLRKEKQLEMEEALWRSRCVDDPAFCLESATNFHSRTDRHFMALLLYDKFNTNALVKLQSLSNSVTSDSAHEEIGRVIKAIKTLRLTSRTEQTNGNQ